MHENPLDIKIFPCDCQDSGCAVIVINDKYEEVVHAEFPVYIAAQSGIKIIDKLLRADIFYTRGNILFEDVPTVVDKNGGAILDGYKGTKEGYIQKLIFGLLQEETEGKTPDPVITRRLNLNGIITWKLDNIEKGTGLVFFRYRKIKGPFKILRTLYEWLSFPLFAISRLAFLIFGTPRIVADCIPDVMKLKAYASEIETNTLTDLFSDVVESGEENDITGKFPIEITLGTKIDSAVIGLAIRKLQCVFYKDGTCEYRLL